MSIIVSFIDRIVYNSRFANIRKKSWKVPDLPMKYSRMISIPKNDSLLENILPVIEHSVKNKENMKFPGHFWKYGRAYLPLDISSFIDV